MTATRVTRTTIVTAAINGGVGPLRPRRALEYRYPRDGSSMSPL
jgi:hypothetical protein